MKFTSAVIILVLCIQVFAIESEEYYARLKQKLPHVSDAMFDVLKTLSNAEKARQLDIYKGVEIVDDKNTKFSHEKAKHLFGEDGIGFIHDLYPPSADIPNDVQTWIRHHSKSKVPAMFIEECLHGLNERDHTVFPEAIALGVSNSKRFYSIGNI